ncbi:MAG: TlpA family protein disulfide reductase [Ignavibacteriaceae bacterium]|nr:TlpA family protein disulfide reductase [Ignavibacteriaceae bacterium]
MKTISASVIFFVFVMFMCSSNAFSQDKKAPNFSLKSVDGKTVKLSDYKNKVVLIDFWATWCPPCRKGIPDLIELQKEFKKDFVVLGISVDSDTKGDVPSFIKNYGINYPIVYGDESTAKLFGGVSGIPTSFLIDRKGNIVDKHVGLVPKETFVTTIKSLLKKQ